MTVATCHPPLYVLLSGAVLFRAGHAKSFRSGAMRWPGPPLTPEVT
jgi:hypothetical protein